VRDIEGFLFKTDVPFYRTCSGDARLVFEQCSEVCSEPLGFEQGGGSARWLVNEEPSCHFDNLPIVASSRFANVGKP
jgi:hypothetical protein